MIQAMVQRTILAMPATIISAAAEIRQRPVEV
jgi:hypothetical protein